MTTIITIAKATPATITTTCGIVVESTSKGVPGQFDKLIELINQLPEGEIVIEAGKLKGIFKALKECSKHCTTFSFVLACNGWGLEPKGDNSWVIVRPQGNIILINGSYIEPTQQPKEVEMEAIENDFNFKYLPFKEQSDINCLLLSIGGKTSPSSLNDIEDLILKASWNEDESVQLAIQELEGIVSQYRPSQIKEKVKTYPVIVYTGEPKLPTVIQLGVVYSTISVETDQGVKEGKFLYTNTGIVTCKGTQFESVEALIVAVQAAFKVETQEVSEATQQELEEVKVKPKTFCQLLREEWLPSRESWVIDSLKRKMRATWKARKELTCERQGKFMAEFFRRLDVYSPNTELPLQAFLTTYDLVKEDMTGQKTQVSVPEALKVIQKDHNTEEVNDAYTNHLNNLLNKFPDRSTAKENVPLEETQEELKENVIETEEELSEGQPSADTTIPEYQLGDILAVTYDDEHNEYAYYGSDFITVKAVVVEGGFQLGEGEDAEVFTTIHELCYKASNGNYEGTPEIKVVTAEEIEAILEKEYNIGMGIE